MTSPRPACSLCSVRDSLRRREDAAAGAERRARRRRARVREVIVDLPAHPLDLLADRRGELVMPLGVGTIGFLRQHRERRLETVSEVAGLGQRAPDGLLAVLEQRVEIVDERLHFGRIIAVDAAIATVAEAREALAQMIHRRQAVAYLREPNRHQGERDEGAGERLMSAAERRHARDRCQRNHVPDHEEPRRPEHRTDDEAGAKGRTGHHASASAMR